MHPAVTRRITTLGISAAAAALAVGTALPAIATPPAGHGNGNPPSTPPGQAKQTSSPAPAPTHTPPGKAKGHSNSHGHATSHAGGNGKSHGHATNHAGGNGKGNNGTGSGHNPPGNNGTVKIHSIAGDPGHHNVAHPGCSFVVDFWGFDQGQTLTVSFTGQAPTGKGTPVTLDAPDGTSVTSPDPAGGGNDPDGELVFTPTASELSVLGAPAKQGYHLRLTVDTGQGGGHKYKVFWVSPCTSTATGSTTPTTTGAAPTGSPTLSTDTPTVRSLHAAAARRGAVTAAGPTPQLESGRLNQASPPVSSLPFTGANVSTLITSGGLALLAGIFLRAAVRRRRKIG
ncbi:MAG: hypothetical protein ACTHK4_14835 [Mycobacteriales bacterium]